MQKKNAISFKLFCYKVFVHWKLKLLDFPMDSVLNSITGNVKECLSLNNQQIQEILLLHLTSKLHVN